MLWDLGLAERVRPRHGHHKLESSSLGHPCPAVFLVSNHSTFPVQQKIILKKLNPISQVPLCSGNRLWPSFWHSHRRACSHTSVYKAKWLTEDWAQLPAGAPCLSQSLTTGRHMYILLHKDTGRVTNTHLLPWTLTHTLAAFPVSCGWHVFFQHPFLPISALFNRVGANRSVYVLWWEAKANRACGGNGIRAAGTMSGEVKERREEERGAKNGRGEEDERRGDIRKKRRGRRRQEI